MKTFVLTIGDELLSGRTLDSNGAYIGRQLSGVGAPVTARATVGDDAPEIDRALQAALKECEVIIITGGLGPTHDDITVEAIGSSLGLSLSEDAGVLERIKARYRQWNRPMPPTVARMAQVPEGAIALDNSRGTAPGLYLKFDDRHIFVLPGVPGEMRGILDESVIPRIMALPGLTPVHTRAIATSGISESALAEKIKDLLPPATSATKVAFLPGYGGVEMRFTSKADPSDMDKLVSAISTRIGLHYIGDATREDLVGRVGRLLSERAETVATAESCTGGLIGKLLTDRPGASKFYMGGVIAYSNAVKEAHLGVPLDTLEKYGAVSGQTAEAMASGVVQKLGATYGVSVTGIAGPDGGTVDKPVGLVYLGLAGPTGTITRELRLSQDREQNRVRSAYAAIDYLRRMIEGHI